MKKLLVIALALCLALSFTACKAKNAAADKIYTLKVSTVLSDKDPIVVGLEDMAKKVALATNNKVVVEVYPSSVLGDTADVLEQAKTGSNVGVIIDTGMLADYVPDMAIYAGPYVFSSIKNARKFIESDIFKAWDDQLATHGLRDLGCNWYQGARNFLTKVKVEKPADLAGIRVRTMGSQVAQESMKALGATPVTLAWSEAYSALQSNVIDAVEAQTTAVFGSSLQEVTSYTALTEHFLLYTALVISEEWFKSLPDDYKTALRETAIAGGDYATELTLEKEVAFKKEMADAGMVFVDVDQSLFKKASASVYEKMKWSELKAKIDAELGQ